MKTETGAGPDAGYVEAVRHGHRVLNTAVYGPSRLVEMISLIQPTADEGGPRRCQAWGSGWQNLFRQGILRCGDEIPGTQLAFTGSRKWRLTAAARYHFAQVLYKTVKLAIAVAGSAGSVQGGARSATTAIYSCMILMLQREVLVSA